MNKIHQQRLFKLTILLLLLALATSLMFYALRQNMNVFVTPTDIFKQTLPQSYHLRLGGVVKPNSLIRDPTSLNLHFIVTDFKNEIQIQYHGILPDLFREGKGVIVEGNLNQQHIFIANFILAKHDENYLPKKVYEELRQA